MTAAGMPAAERRQPRRSATIAFLQDEPWPQTRPFWFLFRFCPSSPCSCVPIVPREPDEAAQRVGLLLDVAFREPYPIQAPTDVVFKGFDASGFDDLIDLFGARHLELEAEVTALGAEGHEVVGLPVLCETDVELVVLELQVRRDLMYQLQHLVRHFHGRFAAFHHHPVVPVGRRRGCILILVYDAARQFVDDLREDERDLLAHLDSLHLDRDERDRAVEQRDDIQESAGYVLGDDDGAVVVLRVSTTIEWIIDP
ncbi:hypothetical protein D3C80_342560 [compost metagenome]